MNANGEWDRKGSGKQAQPRTAKLWLQGVVEELDVEELEERGVPLISSAWSGAISAGIVKSFLEGIGWRRKSDGTKVRVVGGRV